MPRGPSYLESQTTASIEDSISNMFSIPKSLAIIVALAYCEISLAAPASAPTADRVIEVYPGPFLPSLESLGWNSTYINSLPDPVLHNAGMIGQHYLVDTQCLILS